MSKYLINLVSSVLLTLLVALLALYATDLGPVWYQISDSINRRGLAPYVCLFMACYIILDSVSERHSATSNRRCWLRVWILSAGPLLVGIVGYVHHRYIIRYELDQLNLSALSPSVLKGVIGEYTFAMTYASDYILVGILSTFLALSASLLVLGRRTDKV